MRSAGEDFFTIRTNNLILEKAKGDQRNRLDPTVYVIEECSELVKEFMKSKRGRDNRDKIVEEACDVLTTIFVLLTEMEISSEYIESVMRYKLQRAIDEEAKGIFVREE